jgi:hypothetical protein
MNLEARHLAVVERWTMILAALTIAATTLLAPRPVAFGATVGAGLMVANAWAMRRIGTRVLQSAERRGFAILLLNVKLLALIGVVWLAMHFLHVDTLGFLLGVSVFPTAIVAAALQIGLAEPTRGESEHG